MLLIHQVGSVKIGEIVRYTVTYTPSRDRILPSPECLFLRVHNSSSIALRAAFVHGPYALSVAAYPASYSPNEKFQHPRRLGVPEFEPMVKAGGSWTCRLLVPDDIRQTAGLGAQGTRFGAGPEDGDAASVSWIIEVASQVIFSTSAAVSYDVLLARDEKSLSVSTSSSLPAVSGLSGGGSAGSAAGQAQVGQPGRVSDFQKGRDGRYPDQPRGVFSRAVLLKVEDTAALWDTPKLPSWKDSAGSPSTKASGAPEVPLTPKKAEKTGGDEAEEAPERKPTSVHLIVLTHGLHSNLGGDLLFLKESIDAAVKQAKVDKKARLAKEKSAKAKELGSQAQAKAAVDEAHESEEEPVDEDEETIVRGFSGNATRTERGIKYLGKRLARYVLSMTYPDQPYLPAAKSTTETVASVFHAGSSKQEVEGTPAHKHSVIHKAPSDAKRAHKITKISFIGHSLGGLVQTYAVAYIQKHSPQFFDIIHPINFVAMASPFLGLNHENPLYVKFALDFGLVGRTGQDLGLTWRAPTIARSGWGALVSNLGENAQKKLAGDAQPESKPLLRILPTGPAHAALKKFRNRTVYSNVVNDGIVPLRTSCLLFLDWQGLERVDKARRETGLVESLVGAGWAELTGANVTSPRSGPWEPGAEDGGAEQRPSSSTSAENSHEVPQPSTDALLEDDRQSLRTVTAAGSPYLEDGQDGAIQLTATTNNANPFTGFFNFFRSIEPSRPTAPPSQKQKQIYQRSQTLKIDDAASATSATSSKSRVTAGHELADDIEGMSAPPRTTFLESAQDLINPKLPSVEYLIDPSKRPRTIFHDRVYHPSDIPPPPLKKRPATSPSRRRSFHRTVSSNLSNKSAASGSSAKSSGSSPYPSPSMVHEDTMASTRDYDDTANTNPEKDPDEVIDSSGMKVEEKIARAYHKGLSWRKVLVKLEPDAHNNLIVRRMFANAFGWPVVKHLVDAHFSDSAAARVRDEDETGAERARDAAEAPDEHGAETTAQAGVGASGPLASAKEEPTPPDGSKEQAQAESEAQEARDTVPDLPSTTRPGYEESKQLGGGGVGIVPQVHVRPPLESRDSVDWSDRDWADSADESDADEFLAYGNHQGHTQGHHNSHVGTPNNKTEASASKENSPVGAGTPVHAWNWTEKIVGKGAAARKASRGSRLGDEDGGGGDRPVSRSGQDDVD